MHHENTTRIPNNPNYATLGHSISRGLRIPKFASLAWWDTLAPGSAAGATPSDWEAHPSRHPV
jgi:hypothetical protein|uniref:Uncharacterized protein n=1 Tax=Bionectria ochroleuca TaxID=29856 RepID=A0A8H7NEW7_BIOOC